MSKALRRQMTKTASTRQPPAVVGGKRGARTTALTGVRCTPVDPADGRNETVQRLLLDGPMELFQTACEPKQDIMRGDLLTVDGVDYSVRAVAPYDGPPGRAVAEGFMMLYLELLTGLNR